MATVLETSQNVASANAVPRCSKEFCEKLMNDTHLGDNDLWDDNMKFHIAVELEFFSTHLNKFFRARSDRNTARKFFLLEDVENIPRVY